MTRLKGDCEECGRAVANAKLIMIPGCDKRLCNICRRREEKRLNKLKLSDFKPQINNSNTNVLEKQKKLVRPSKFIPNRLTKDEEMVLKSKYKFDGFISGQKICKEIINIKDRLKNNQNWKRKLLDKEIKKSNENKEKNNKFLEGLK